MVPRRRGAGLLRRLASNFALDVVRARETGDPSLGATIRPLQPGAEGPRRMPRSRGSRPQSTVLAGATDRRAAGNTPVALGCGHQPCPGARSGTNGVPRWSRRRPDRAPTGVRCSVHQEQLSTGDAVRRVDRQVAVLLACASAPGSRHCKKLRKLPALYTSPSAQTAARWSTRAECDRAPVGGSPNERLENCSGCMAGRCQSHRTWLQKHHQSRATDRGARAGKH